MFSDCNAAAAWLAGRSRQELLGQSPATFSPARQPEGRNSGEMAREKIQTALEGNSQFFAWTLLGADGSPMFTEVSLNRIAAALEPTLLAICATLPTAKRSEEVLRQSEQEFHSLAEAMPQIVWVTRARWLEHLLQPTMGGLHRADAGGKLRSWLEHSLPP